MLCLLSLGWGNSKKPSEQVPNLLPVPSAVFLGVSGCLLGHVFDYFMLVVFMTGRGHIIHVIPRHLADNVLYW